MTSEVNQLHVDRKDDEIITIDDAGRVVWTRRGGRVECSVTTPKRTASLHHPDRTLLTVRDLAAFVEGATAVSERSMQWTAGDGNAMYREAIRFSDRVLLVWGRNNARDLQSVGITTTQASARALVAALRANPLKGYKETSPYFLDGRGAVVREYWPVPGTGKRGTVTRARGTCIDNRVQWTTSNSPHKREELVEELPTDAAAEQRFDALELDWYRRGGRPYEIEWTKSEQRRADYSIYEWFGRHGDRPAPRAFAMQLLAAAKLRVDELPENFEGVCTALQAAPAAHWVRIGETVGTLARKPGPQPNTELVLDHSLHTVTKVTRTKVGTVKTVKVKRAKSAAGAKALFDAG